jgi:subtilisin-like proprotein convertase family protein
VESETSSPFLAIPDSNAVGVSDTIAISGSGITEIEWVNVTFSAADHPYFADLRVVLESPAGTQSVLTWPHLLIDPDAPCNVTAPFQGMVYDDWVFATGACLDESADGTWTLTVSDEATGDVGTFQSWTLTVHGH